VGLWQGAGSDARDNNDKFGYTGNVWGKLVGIKVNLGYMSSDNTPPSGNLPPVPVPPATSATRTDEYQAAVIGVAYERGPILLRTEFYDAERDRISSAGVTSTQDLSGYYVMGVFTVISDLDVMARFQQFEDDAFGTSNNEVTSTDLGVKYYFDRKGRGGSSVSLNYMLRDADTGVTQKIFDERGANVKGDNVDDVIMARLQVQY
jgi:hypothetical protein